jgi:diguanylate cyclase (GGDEF)-like protein
VSKYLCSILVVDDEPHILATLSNLLSEDFEVLVADSPATAQNVFRDRRVDIVLTDQRMPGMTGVQLLEWVREYSPTTVRLLMTGFAELEEAVDAINRGGVFRYLFKPWKVETLLDTLRSAAHTFILEHEHKQLMEQLRRLNEELEQRVKDRTHELRVAYHELEQKNKMLEKLALTDALTGLPNRRAMDRLAERELRRRERHPGAISIGLADVDHFKNINSQYLLPGGDKVLVDLARCLSSSLRTIDFLGRIGGEEFLIIAPETDFEGAQILGERVRSMVERNRFTYKDNEIPVTISIGFAVAETGVVAEYEQMKLLAAAALAEAKLKGRNRCVIASLVEHPFEQAG